jgi:hypothetical protein
MIYLVCRPLARNHAPDQTMREVVLAVNHHLHISMPLAYVASDLPKGSPGAFNEPAENSRARVVIKQLTKLFRRERISVSHAASFYQRWGVIRAAAVFPAPRGSLI